MSEVESIIYEKLQDGAARCLICERRCVIPEGGWGYCYTRKNRGGKIYSVVYGEVAARHIAPIEAKPVFHFLPGSRWLSLGTVGCNLRCIGCQNWEIAHETPCTMAQGKTIYMSPDQVVKMAKQMGCDGISWTYNEPTMWLEYTMEVSRLAKKAGLYTNYVTNGFMTKSALDRIGQYIDIFRVDIKGFSNDFYSKIANVTDFTPVLENAIRAKSRWNMHVEVVTNVIPNYNDSEIELGRLATWIATKLGKASPWHLTRFVPYLKLEDVPCTPVETLEKARQIAMDVGLLYVYIGNVIGHPAQNTYCPKCSRVVIGRYHFSIIAYNISNGRCRHCGQRIAGTFSK